MVYRSVIALTQGLYIDFFKSGLLQAIGLLGQLVFTASIVISFFWLISYRLLQESQQAEEQLKLTKDELETLNRELQIAVMMDGLTQIANRRYFDEQYIRLWRDAKRHGKPLSVILADIDVFKAYNDEYGHQAGDDCLRQVARTLRNSTKRAADFVARYGGEEFIVILPETDVNGAEKLAERLRTNVQKLNIAHNQSPVGNVTISLGIATTIPTEDQEPLHLVTAADKALYDAKRAGRNCVRREVPEG
jgi:diguanylate cyclase (GGDEF)-like protein